MISTVTETKRQATEQATKEQLLSLAQDLGSITLDDVLSLFPEAEKNLDQLEEVFQALLEAGVAIENGDGAGAALEQRAEARLTLPEGDLLALAVGDVLS